MGSAIGARNRGMWFQETHPRPVEWTRFLGSDAVGLLRSLIHRAYRHRPAYMRAEDVGNAQLWSALVEVQRQIDELSERVSGLEPKDFRVLKRDVDDDDRRRASDAESRIEDAARQRGQDTEEATDALIQSLMRF